jgi:hypothetical protein
MPEWKDVVPSMVDNFGTRAECVEMLLEFLKSLVEEASNGRIPISVSFTFSKAKPAYILSSRVKTELRSLGTIVRVAVKSE